MEIHRHTDKELMHEWKYMILKWFGNQKRCLLFKLLPTGLQRFKKKKSIFKADTDISRSKNAPQNAQRLISPSDCSPCAVWTGSNASRHPHFISPYWDCAWLSRHFGTLKTLNTQAAVWLQPQKIGVNRRAARGFMYTHSCVFPRKAEKGVGAGSVSHVPQHWQQLHCVTGLGTKKKNTWRILGDWCWCQNKQMFKNPTSNLRFWLLKVSRSVLPLF